MFTLVIILRILFDHLPCMFVALYGFILQSSLVIVALIFICQGLIHMAIAHQWAWVHEWEARSVQTLCAIIISVGTAGVAGLDLYQVRVSLEKLSTVFIIFYNQLQFLRTSFHVHTN